MNSDEMKTILIIGAGLGGLALAQLLQQELNSSIKVIVFERDVGEDFRDQGYFITINQMGIDVLKRISAVDEIFSSPSTMSNDRCHLKLADKSMNTMLEMTTGEIKVIERAALRRNLLKNINVQWNKRFVSYNILDDGVEVHFEDGSCVKGTLLVGCDGAKSLVRAQLIPELQREDTGVVHISGTIEENDQLIQIKQLVTNSLVQVLGDQGHALFLTSTGKLWLWSLFWSSTDITETKISLIELIEKVRTNFNNEEFIRLIELSSSIRLDTLRTYSLPLLKVNPFPNNPRIILLGDAAHLMTPQRGMGANTSFADALDLVDAIRLGHTKASLADYEEKMFKRGFEAVQKSLESTRMATMIGVQARIRDYIFWFLHYSIALKNLISVPFNWYWNRTS